MAAIDRDFWLEDLGDVLEQNAVAGAVVVQASNSSQETLDLLTAALPPRVLAIVGWVDLESPNVGDALGEALAAPNGASLSGVRHLAHLEDDSHWLTRQSVSRGLNELEAAGLSFDFVVTPDQLEDCARVSTDHPNLLFVLDHLGKPPIRSAELGDWESALRGLAALPNVYAKLSGLTMEADWSRWAVDDLERAFIVALECFGTERLMFGSDWPLVEVCGGYTGWLDAARALTSTLSVNERAAIFATTARTAYRIQDASRA